MATQPSSRSPLNVIGGKGRLAQRIVAAFPDASKYDVYVEPFCGSCAVLFAKPSSGHLEVINDRNERLINFWMQVREEVEHLTWKLDTLPYSERLFKRYSASLNGSEALNPIEEAARWYYVNRSIIGGYNDSKKGWACTGALERIKYSVPSKAASYQYAVELLSALSERLARVQIHAWDFEKVITKYQTTRTLIYSDAPYHGAESHYETDGTPPFTKEDHKRLARLLNASPASVAVSYYDCPELEEDYPTTKWRRVYWETVKETSRMNGDLQKVREVLLMNYDDPAQAYIPLELWSMAESAR